MFRRDRRDTKVCRFGKVNSYSSGSVCGHHRHGRVCDVYVCGCHRHDRAVCVGGGDRHLCHVAGVIGVRVWAC